jgi:hypothetical protein
MNNDEDLYVYGDVRTDPEGNKWLCLGKNKWALIMEADKSDNDVVH